MALIKYDGITEGEIFNKWLYSRLIKHNKNVLSAELGSTGSGKSYRDLRKAELWYLFHFNKPFPAENICFGVAQTMEILSSERLKRGEILVIEEAGVNLGSRNWQSKVSKMFNFVLQSFRSMNIALFFNLPYLSMLDSQARHLLHYYAESSGIDYENKTNKCKPFFLQVAQGTGKIYRHYPKVKVDSRTIKVNRFLYSLPSKYLMDAYEEKKDKYLKNIIKEYSDKTNGKDKSDKERPTPIEEDCHHMYHIDRISYSEIGKRKNLSRQTVSSYVKKAEKWKKKNNIDSFTNKNEVFAKETREMSVKSKKQPLSNLTYT